MRTLTPHTLLHCQHTVYNSVHNILIAIHRLAAIDCQVNQGKNHISSFHLLIDEYWYGSVFFVFMSKLFTDASIKSLKLLSMECKWPKMSGGPKLR